MITYKFINKAWPQSIMVAASILSASLSILCNLYIWEGFGSSTDSIFTKLTPAIIGIVVVSLIGLWILLRHTSGSWVSILVSIALILISHLIYYRLIQSFFHYAIDDTFITFRYSRNLADGFGPTWNPGIAPIEGYTTFLWMLIMSIPHVLSFDALIFSKLLGVVLGELTLIFGMLVAARVTASNQPEHQLVAAAITSLFISAFYPTAIHTVSGMETILFSALLACLVYLAILSTTSKSAALMAPFAMLLLGLTRPEGNLLNAGILAVLYFAPGAQYRKTLLYSCMLLYLLPGIIYFVWRVSYYQMLFPLPYYSKLGMNHGPEGIANVLNFVLTLAPSVMIPLLFAFRNPTRGHAIVAAPIVLLLLFYLFPQHVMSVYSRFVFPAAPLLFVLAGAGAANLLAESAWSWNTRSNTMKSAFAVACIALVALSPLANITSIRSQIQGAVRAINPYIYFGRLLGSFPAAKPMTLAIGDAGAIPYYSQWKAIDLVGLNDPRTLFKRSTEAYMAYVFENQPDLVLLTFNDPETPLRDVPLTQEIYEAALGHGMEKVGVVKVSDTYYLWVCARTGSPLAEYLQNALQQ